LAGVDAGNTDSQNLLDAFLGNSTRGRDVLILEATTRTALRTGDWKMIPPYEGAAINTQVNIELGNAEEYQLFNLKEDIGEQNNLAESNPEQLETMKSDFEGIRGVNFGETEQLELK
jgi:hypothetical protein